MYNETFRMIFGKNHTTNNFVPIKNRVLRKHTGPKKNRKQKYIALTINSE